MYSAWSGYLFPLAISIWFVVGGLVAFGLFGRGARNSRGRKYGSSTASGGVLFVIIGTLFGLAVIITSPTPWARQKIFDHVFRTPPERIERFVIKAGNDRDSITRVDVVISDPARIRQIANDLRTSEEISPNHPSSRWATQVEMVTLDGTYYFSVAATEPGDVNGTLVSPETRPDGGRWNLGSWRADGLETILQDAVSPRRARP